MNKRILELREIIRATEAEIIAIQTQCQHETTTPEMYMWRIGAFLPMLICNECGKGRGGITKEQEDEVWRTWRNDDFAVDAAAGVDTELEIGKAWNAKFVRYAKIKTMRHQDPI